MKTETTLKPPDPIGDEHPYWLSIAVPSFNAAKYLGSLVETLASQWSPGIEIVMVDDASTDGTADIIRAFQSDTRLTIRASLRTLNQGIAATRNELIANCRGDYIWFIDADDVVLPGSVNEIKGVLDQFAPDLLMFGFKNLHGHQDGSWRLGSRQYNCLTTLLNTTRTDTPWVLVELFDAQQLHVWSKVARRSVWTTLRFPEGRTYEDIAISPLLVMASKSIHHLNRACIAYRRHPESITARMSGARLKDLGRSLELAIKALSHRPDLASRALSLSIARYAARIQATMWRNRAHLPAHELAGHFPLSADLYQTLKLTPCQLAGHLALRLHWKTLSRVLASGLLKPLA